MSDILQACDRMDVNPETSAVREIIDDALNGRRVFAETARTHLALPNIPSAIHTKRDRPTRGDLFFCLKQCFRVSIRPLTKNLTSVLTSPTPRNDAPVAQRIEHLPCWSLNGEEYLKNSLSGRPHMRGRPESLWYSITLSNNPGGLGNPQETCSQQFAKWAPQRLYGSGL